MRYQAALRPDCIHSTPLLSSDGFALKPGFDTAHLLFGGFPQDCINTHTNGINILQRGVLLASNGSCQRLGASQRAFSDLRQLPAVPLTRLDLLLAPRESVSEMPHLNEASAATLRSSTFLADCACRLFRGREIIAIVRGKERNPKCTVCVRGATG